MIPNKLKKHLTLVEFGLRTKEDFDNDIHRYGTSQVDKLLSDIKKEMRLDKGQNFYLISSIPAYDHYKLPNFCAYTPEDLQNFKNSLSNSFYHNFSEVWYFKKPYQKDQQIDSSIGRIGIEDRNNTTGDVHSIEQVWNCSHRNIEQWNSKADSYYLRASRPNWNMRYQIDALHTPNKDMQKVMLEQFFESVRSIEQHREKIEAFLEYLKSLDIDEVSLEYMYTPIGFRFIDWDTCNDRKVIDSLFYKDETLDYVK